MKFERMENKKLDEQLLYGRHESGLKVYILPKKGFSKYYAIYGTEYGSINREFVVPGESEVTVLPDGVAHFLEHKLFEEEDGGNAFDKFSLTGASSNAFTSFDMTAYLFTCTDKFYENLDILLEFVNNPYFTDENVAKEQGIIGQEIKMYEDDPGWRVFFNMLKAIYHNNPVKIDIAGSVDSIAKITPELLYKCTKTFYNPSNMKLVLVGDIDPDEVVKYVDKYVNAEKDMGEIDKRYADEPETIAQEIIEQNLSVSSPLFQIGFKEKTAEITGRELLKKEIVTSILLEVLFGKSSEFYRTLYEQGLIDNSFEKDTELEKEYGFSALGGESKDPKKVFEFTKAYINKIKETGISQDDAIRAKKVLVGRNLRKYNSVENIGIEFIKRLFNGINLFEYTDVVEEVTIGELNERLIEHFDTSNCVLSVVNPA